MSEGIPFSRREAVVSSLAMLVTLVGLYALIRYYGLDDVRTYVEEAGVWAPLVLVFAKASTLVIAPLGGGPLYPVAGAIFGFWESFVLLMCGDILGGVIAFWLGRIYGQRATNYFFPDKTHILQRILGMFTTTRGLLVTRIILIPLPELFIYAAGVSRARFLPFLLVYSIINAAPTAFLVSLGTLLPTSYGPAVIPVMLVISALLGLVSIPTLLSIGGTSESRETVG